MKLYKISTLVIVVALIMAIAPAASAQGPAGNWISGIACQNLDAVNTAHATLSFYPEGNGTSALDYAVNILPSDSLSIITPNIPGLPDAFLGSVVVSSDTELVCNVNTQTTGTGTQADPYRIGTSSGFADAGIGPSMYVPQVMKAFSTSNWNTYFAVQNATANVVHVAVSYKDRYGAAVPAADESADIPAFSNKVFYQADNAGLPTNFLGAASVAGNGDIAVVANQYNGAADYTTAQLLSYNGFAAGSTTLNVPRFVRKFYGYNGGMSIQNIGANPTTVTIDFVFAGNTYTYVSSPINSGAALPLYAPNITVLNPVDGLATSQRFGSATITSSGEPIIAIVNEDNRGLAADNDGNPVPTERIGQGNTYNAFLEGVQTDTVFLAQVTSNAGGIFSGGFQIANSTNTATTCTATFTKTGFVYNFNLPASGSNSVFAPNTGVGTYNGPVTVVCGQPVFGIMNMAVNAGSGKFGDSFTCTNGVNR